MGATLYGMHLYWYLELKLLKETLTPLPGFQNTKGRMRGADLIYFTLLCNNLQK
jgi:hypothetical protein